MVYAVTSVDLVTLLNYDPYRTQNEIKRNSKKIWWLIEDKCNIHTFLIAFHKVMISDRQISRMMPEADAYGRNEVISIAILLLM